MTYKSDKKYLRKVANTYLFHRDWREENKRKHFTKSLGTSSLTEARKYRDEILSRWDEILVGEDLDWYWESDSRRTTVKDKRLDEAIEQYLKHKKAENLAPNSIKRMGNSLKNLIDFLGTGFNYKSIKSSDLDEFKTRIGRHRTPSGVNVDVRNIRTFLNWLFYTERINRQIPIKSVKETKRKPQYLTEDDIKSIFSLETVSQQMKRFWSFYLSTGLRRSAPFVGYMDGNWLVIPADAPFNKSKVDIEVCLDSQLQKVWEEMMELKEEWLSRGRKFENLVGKITKEFKRAIRECGLNERHHLHNTRHTFAVREWLRTGNIYAVKEQLAHSTVAVTEQYMQHKRSKISADHPSFTKQVAEVPKSMDLIDNEQLLTNLGG